MKTSDFITILLREKLSSVLVANNDFMKESSLLSVFFKIITNKVLFKAIYHENCNKQNDEGVVKYFEEVADLIDYAKESGARSFGVAEITDTNDNRVCGKSTRLIDYYIQELFENIDNWVLIQDHYPQNNNHALLCKRIAKRLYIEHDIKVQMDILNFKLKISSIGKKVETNNEFVDKLRNEHYNDLGKNLKG